MLDKYSAERTDGRITVQIKLLPREDPRRLTWRVVFEFLAELVLSGPVGRDNRRAVIRISDAAGTERQKFVVSDFDEARKVQDQILAKAKTLSDDEVEELSRSARWYEV